MRYRRLSYRYAVVVGSGQTWPRLAELWPSKRFGPLMPAGWRPDADMFETAATVEIIVDLAGADEDDVEVQLFEDALVVEGQRRLPGCEKAAVYHAASIRQGPFRLELPLPVPVNPDRVEARYDRGMLRITLAKQPGAR
jgi:HSP20 family protein